MIIPLFYEGRIIQQYLEDESLLDKYFDMITNGLDKEEKAALKTRFSRSKMLSQTKEAIYAKAFDISTHYLKTFKGTGLKGMLIAPSRLIAVRFKKILDDIGQVSSEVVISSTDDREGYKDIESENEVDKFLKNMREQYGLKFNNRIIKKFKSSGDPEILIVVSKLLTGFDAPRNVVIYICKELKEHNLLQAIARANRLFEEKGKIKEYGYIIDYVGLLNQLKQAHQFYNNYGLNNFDREDLEDAIFFVDDKLKELFPLLQEIKNIFINVPNDLDSEQLEQHLADETIRNKFYFLLNKFKNLMFIASNSNKLSEVSSKELKNELKRFNKLKEIVEKRYKEKPDKKIYTTQITKLLDEHVIVGNITKTEAVNIFDDEMFEKFIKRTEIAVMDMVNQIQDTIKDYINIDPAFYQKFSTLINNTIIQHHNKRLSDSDLLNRVKKIRAELKKDVPSELSNNKTKLVFYRKLLNFLQDKTNQNQCKNAIQIARDTYDIIKQKTIVHWTKNTKILNEMRNSLDDYFFDVVEKKIGIIFKPEDLNEVVESLIDFAKEHGS